LTIGLQEGIGFLFALTDASDGFHLHGDWEPNVHAGFVPPSSAWMPLLLHSTGQVSYWNDRWEKMTGLTVESDSRSELVLDWLFPRQRDRETIADWLHQPARRGGQAVLDVVTPTGSKPMLCTLLLAGATELAEGSGESKERHGENWLLLVGEPDLFAGDVKPTHGFMRQFARGLGVLLNQYLTLPIGLSEEALSRPDLPAQVGAWFQQILDSCQRSSHLIAALEDLSALTLGEVQPVSFVTLIREFLDELPPSEERDYELNVKLGDTEVPVKVNRRMIRTVLRHLFTNAAQALIGSDRRTIEVRLHADEETARCEIHDTGEGFPSEEWTRAPVPFQSTKGPFARDPAHAALEATGLGLTVCRHLIMLHQGRLELISNSGGGTTAAMILPRSGHLSSENAEASSGGEAVRVDQSASTTSSRHPAVPTPKPPQQM